MIKIHWEKGLRSGFSIMMPYTEVILEVVFLLNSNLYHEIIKSLRISIFKSQLELSFIEPICVTGFMVSRGIEKFEWLSITSK